ncbi:P-loop containing nucleoside triphosphate hydrolase protein [Crassisporium funariophilum]|nr:P-loop containing nucleoside triphosphate hydrolase protein [Crassisporium funariophilum]
MASSTLWAQAARVCASNSTRAVRSVPVLNRSFVVFACRRSALPRHVFSPLLARNASSATAAKFALADEETTTIIETRPHFDTLRGVIHPNTLKAITVRPFQHTHMSPVQEQILPLLPDLARPHDPSSPSPKDRPRDLLVKAKTGTGKTMAFLIPAIEARLQDIDRHVEQSLVDSGIAPSPVDKAKATMRYAKDHVGTLIISPTRELATQIAVEASNLTAHHQGFQVRILLGGESRYKQISQWQGRKDIVVATPGRILDLLASEPEFEAALKHTKLLVLDEADTLLHMGFREDIERLKSYLPPSPERQTFLFSATVSSAIQQVAKSTLSSSHRFVNCVSKDDSPVHDHIPQYHTVVPKPEQTLPHLLRLITQDQLTAKGLSKIIVFFSTTKMVQMFSDFLRDAGPTVLPSGRATRIYEMHSKRDMNKRISTSKAFRADTSGNAILVTSDVSARGVDYPGVSRVIQMGLPADADMYIHRVGRTGRGNNKTGRGDLVISPWEMNFLRSKLHKVPLKPLTVSDLESQTKELVEEADAAKGTGHTHALKLSEIEPTATAVGARVDFETASETFMSQIGFYVGRMEDLGLQREEVVTGLQTWIKDVCSMDRAPHISPNMMQKLGLGGRGFSSRGSSSRGGGGGFAGRSWEGRGRQGEKSFGGERSRGFGERSAGGSGGFGERSSGGSGGFGRSSGGSGGFGRSSYGSGESAGFGRSSYGSGDSSSFGQRSSGGFAQRSPGGYGQRSSTSSFTPRGDFSRGGDRSGSSGGGRNDRSSRFNGLDD